MRLSLFRSKSNTTSPSPSSSKKSNRFSHMLSPTRSKQDDHSSSHHSSPRDLSPVADHTDASLLSPNPPSQDPQPTASDLAPPAPSDGNESLVGGSSSVHEPSSNADDEQSSVDEYAMTRKLMDVESSFLPDPAPVSNGPSSSVVSTAVNDQLSSRNAGNDIAASSRTTRDTTSPFVSNTDQLQATSTRTREFTRPTLPFPDEDQISYGDSSSIQSPVPPAFSSPAAAAAHRTKLRATSNYLGVSRRLDGTRSLNRSPAIQEASSAEEQLSSAQTGSPKPLGSSSTLLPYQEGMLRKSGSFERYNRSQPRYSRRPEHLRSRQSAQRASKDSFLSQKSEMTIGPGYDGHSGDATPGTNARASRELSRLPSLGSVASSISGGTEVVASRSRKGTASAPSMPKDVASLDQQADDMDEKSLSQLETPRASTQTATAGPSNTVIAQHVRDIEVPDTVAREYRATHQNAPAESQSINSTPFYGRGKTNLTLKEQNSKMDKLSKENFDLKLKIHFLHQALQDRSDEGVSHIISQNAQLQADLVKAKKENQTLRKRLRELEGKQKGWENASTSLHQSLEGSEDDSSRANVQAQLEDEIVYLRDQIQLLTEDNTKLLQGGQPEWDTLDREVVRRKQAEREVRELQQQVERLKGNGDRLPHLRIRASNTNLAQSEGVSAADDRDIASLSGNTLVEQLKYENATLRRDLGAQTDMLSSRNRERERLQQEIEDLKLVQRRGDRAASAAGDSILDRSVSRAQQRSTSRASQSTRDSNLSDPDRDRLENIQAALRDENASLKMRNQDLHRELNSLGEGAEHIRTLQRERDDATQALREADGDIDYLYDQMNQLEELVLQKEQDIAALEVELHDQEDENAAFRRELKSINESFNKLADDSEANQATIQSLQQDIANANGELEAMETNLRDAAAAKERLEVQQESAGGEIAFLREEQEADKLRIGDLQSALASAKLSLKGEEAKLHEFEELQSQATKARDEARELRKTLTTRDNEATHLHSNLDELRTTLDEAGKDFEKTKASLQEEIKRLRSDSEQRLRELDQASMDYDEKDRLLRDREGLLELSGHETRRLTELLEKERQARKHDRNEFDRALRSVRGSPEARIAELEMANSEGRKKVADLNRNLGEQLQARDALFLSLWNRLSGLCTREKLMEPEHASQTVESISNDIQAFDHHLSTVIETIEAHVSGFRQELLKTEKAVWKGFTDLELALNQRKTRIDTLEKDMQQLTEAQSERISDNATTVEYLTRLKQENRLLKRELRYLKQGSFALPGLPSPHDEEQDRRNFAFDHQALTIGSLEPGDPSLASKSRNRHSAAHGSSMLLRTHSANGSDSTRGGPDDQEQPNEPLPQRSISNLSTIPGTSNSHSNNQQMATNSREDGTSSAGEQRWMLKLEALKRNLRAEREGRLLDRDGARKRLEEGKRQSEALKEELRREKVKNEAAAAAGASAGSPTN